MTGIWNMVAINARRHQNEFKQTYQGGFRGNEH